MNKIVPVIEANVKYRPDSQPRTRATRLIERIVYPLEIGNRQRLAPRISDVLCVDDLELETRMVNA
jgi:hypothetical protein